jgi:hypothetical protein
MTGNCPEKIVCRVLAGAFACPWCILIAALAVTQLFDGHNPTFCTAVAATHLAGAFWMGRYALLGSFYDR